MKTPIRAVWPPNDYLLVRMFAWLTRIGAAPAFGDLPIGWYQMHQCAAIKALEASKGAGLILRCKAGMIQAKAMRGSRASWLNVFTASQLFDMADKACRS